MGLGSAITALAFMLISVAQVLISLFVLSYAAYSFLVTLTSTAAGNDEVRHPKCLAGPDCETGEER